MKNKSAVKILMALAQESRLSVFRLIVKFGERGITPKHIVKVLRIPNATVSFHLKELMHADLVLVEKIGRNLFYKPNPLLVQKVTDFLLENCCGGQNCMTKTPITAST